MKTMFWVIRQEDNAESLDEALRVGKSADIWLSSGVVGCLCIAFNKRKPKTYMLGLTKRVNANQEGQKATRRVLGSIWAGATGSLRIRTSHI